MENIFMNNDCDINLIAFKPTVHDSLWKCEANQRVLLENKKSWNAYRIQKESYEANWKKGFDNSKIRCTGAVGTLWALISQGFYETSTDKNLVCHIKSSLKDDLKTFSSCNHFHRLRCSTDSTNLNGIAHDIERRHRHLISHSSPWPQK